MKKVLHIVKRFGPVGGMERYVWELSHALAKQEVEVHVLCEQAFQTVEQPEIIVHQLGKNIAKPRWLSMLIFSFRVSRWLAKQTEQFIVHSHERIADHQVTTFHTTLFAYDKPAPWWKQISLRKAVWRYLEKREVCGEQVQAILPNSGLIGHQLKEAYPQLQSRLQAPAYPAVHRYEKLHKPKRQSDVKIILFVGQEWKRKGLEKAVGIVDRVQQIREKVHFWVLGPESEQIAHLFTGMRGDYQLLGWQDSEPFLEKADLLLHPATSEAYGMAIAEASNAEVPVVVSRQCGIAARLTPASGSVLDAEEPVDHWVSACLSELDRSDPVKPVGQTWDELAAQHKQIYQQIALSA